MMNMGKGMETNIRNGDTTRVLERGILMTHFLCWDPREIFRSGGGQTDVERSSANVVIHTTTDFKTPYMMYV